MPKGSRIAISSPRYYASVDRALAKADDGFPAQNVLLTRDNPPNVKVADFGLAKVVDSLTMLRVRRLFRRPAADNNVLRCFLVLDHVWNAELPRARSRQPR